MPFALDPRLEASSFLVAALGLSELRLQNDLRFTWCVLIPRRAGCVDIDDLCVADANTLLAEIGIASRLVRTLMVEKGRPADKLNVAALGNIVSQLHVHVVGRRRDDVLWPDPVWGRGTTEPLGPAAASALVAAARLHLLNDQPPL